MQISSQVDPKPRDPPSFLLCGPPGGGKTTLALQFPGLWVGDCDINLNGPEKYLRDNKWLGTYFYDSICFNDNGSRLEFPDAWEKLMGKAEEAVLDADVQTLFFDSLTAINNMLVAWVMKKQGLVSSAVMERQHWIPFRNQLMLLINKARTSGKVIIMSAHVWDQLDKKGVVEKHRIAVSTTLTHYFAAYFTDVWRCYSTPGRGGNSRFYIQCLATGLDDLKNSFGMLAEVEVTGHAFERLNSWMKLPLPPVVVNSETVNK